MTSLVSEFIIHPVLRQARRFSSPFATDPGTERLRQLSGSRIDIEEAVTDDEDLITPSRPALLRLADLPLGSITPPLLIPRPRGISRSLSDNEVSRLSIAITGPEMDHIVEMSDPDDPAHVRDIGEPLDELPDAPSNDPGSGPSTPADPNNRKIPADDGKKALRRKILGIQSRRIANEEKARLMHELLTEGYVEAKRAKSKIQAKATVSLHTPESPPSPTIWDDPLAAVGNLRFWTASSRTCAIPVTAEDMQPTYVPAKSRNNLEDLEASMRDLDSNDDLAASALSEKTLQPLGCDHYKRNVKLQCATCEKWHTCRLCHDAVEDHTLPRRETKHMLCMLCGFAQKASDCCVSCGQTAAQYYCNVCKLWNDDIEKELYHCDDCGICRVGHGRGKDFFHCKTCRACIAVNNGQVHKCIERVTDCDCPICGEHMFSSQRTVIFMECGHCIHKDCFNQHLNSSYKCPICSKSCVNMEATFRNLDVSIREQPMPEGFHNLKCVILCNDCSAKGPTDFHFLGLRCQICRSYNTVELQRLPAPGEEDEAEGESRDGHENQDHRESPASARLPVQSIWPQDGVSWNHMSGLASAQPSPGFRDHVMDGLQAGPSVVQPDPVPNSVALNPNDTREDEEELDFWGRRGADNSEGDDSEDGNEDSDTGDEGEGEDEFDEEYEEDIVLFGHR